MKKYSIDYTCCDAEYEVWVNTNYIIDAKNETDAMKTAAKMEGTISKYIKPFYDREKKIFLLK